MDLNIKKQYYYIRNSFGIVDENGKIMVAYKYDSWGKMIDKY